MRHIIMAAMTPPLFAAPMELMNALESRLPQWPIALWSIGPWSGSVIGIPCTIDGSRVMAFASPG
jgi:hypothetical protein